MSGILALQKRMTADAGRIYWQPKDYERLARHYKVDADAVAKLATPTPHMASFPGIVSKEAAAAGDVQRSFKWVMNDGTEPDRSGDIVNPRGVSLRHFKTNPIALLQHSPDLPIGTWSNVHAADGKLKGTLTLAIDAFPLAESVRKGITAGVYRAASIGFLPTEWEFRRDGPGMLFHAMDLMECSVCAIGASPGALREREMTPAERREQAAGMRRLAAEDLAYVAQAERDAELEARLARTTPAQRKREREAALLRIKGSA
jgi:HK97 family phage prohead protease